MPTALLSLSGAEFVREWNTSYSALRLDQDCAHTHSLSIESYLPVTAPVQSDLRLD